MANTTLTQTGAEVQAILDKADKLPSSLGTAGQVLTMNAGATAAEWKTPSGGYTLTVTQADEQYWVFFADGSYQNYNSGVVGTYHNVVALGMDNNAIIYNETGFYLYCTGTTFSGGTLPLGVFIGHQLPSGATVIRILLSDKTCAIESD